MKVKQVSVFLENRPGRMKDMLEVLAEQKVDIRALSIGDTADFGIVRMVLSDTDKALSALREQGFVASTTEVLQVSVPDKPGGLLESVVKPLADAQVNIEYIYAFVERPAEAAMVVLKVSDPDKAAQILTDRG